MYKRFLVTTILAAALLFSQGGNFLVAALCPHLQSGMASCETKLADAAMSHEGMGHMGMEHETAPRPNPDATALDQPKGACSHCAVHSRPNPNTASLRQAETAKRSADLNVPLHFFKVPPVAVSPVAVLPSRAHGPPGDPTATYLLINIFRI